jgi:hypothetical protein
LQRIDLIEVELKRYLLVGLEDHGWILGGDHDQVHLAVLELLEALLLGAHGARVGEP